MKTMHELNIMVQEQVFHQGRALSLQGHTAEIIPGSKMEQQPDLY